MPNFYDVAYAVGLGCSAPVWLLIPKGRVKVLAAFRQRMGQVGETSKTVSAAGIVMIHAVSMGELNATPRLIRLISAARPDLRFLVTVTSDTGFARAQQLYGADPLVVFMRYPLDFSGAINRVLNTYRPVAVVLMELEIWPNFILQCHRRRIPVILANGRLTPRSFRIYRLFKLLLAPTFRRLSAVCAQEQTYASRFLALGAPTAAVIITGSMKFDTAEVADRIAGDAELAATLGLHLPGEPIWVCGSTGPGEEVMILRCYRKLLADHPMLRLVIVPRHPQRFDNVATLISRERFDLVRRSHCPAASGGRPVILGDTMGELRKFYSIATVVFVGRSLVDLGSRQHGSDMIEAAALAKPVIVGSWTHNFAEPMSCFRRDDAIEVVADESALPSAVSRLLNDAAAAQAMGRRAQEVVRRERGASERTVEILLKHLPQAISPPTGPT